MAVRSFPGFAKRMWSEVAVNDECSSLVCAAFKTADQGPN